MTDFFAIQPQSWAMMCCFMSDYLRTEWLTPKLQIFINTQSDCPDKLVTRDTECYRDTLKIIKTLPKERLHEVLCDLLEDVTETSKNEQQILSRAENSKNIYNHFTQLIDRLQGDADIGIGFDENNVVVCLVDAPAFCPCCIPKCENSWCRNDASPKCRNSDHYGNIGRFGANDTHKYFWNLCERCDDLENVDIHDEIAQLPTYIMGKHMTKTLWKN